MVVPNPAYLAVFQPTFDGCNAGEWLVARNSLDYRVRHSLLACHQAFHDTAMVLAASVIHLVDVEESVLVDEVTVVDGEKDAEDRGYTG